MDIYKVSLKTIIIISDGKSKDIEMSEIKMQHFNKLEIVNQILFKQK